MVFVQQDGTGAAGLRAFRDVPTDVGDSVEARAANGELAADLFAQPKLLEAALLADRQYRQRRYHFQRIHAAHAGRDEAQGFQVGQHQPGGRFRLVGDDPEMLARCLGPGVVGKVIERAGHSQVGDQQGKGRGQDADRAHVVIIRRKDFIW